MTKRSIITGLLMGLIALLTAACDAAVEDTTTSNGEETTTAEATTTAVDMTTSTTTAMTTTTASPTGEFSDGEYQTEDYPQAGEPLFLTAVDVETRDDFDRVVFHLDGDASNLSYQIEPVTEEEFSSPDGDAPEVDGEAYYEISIAPASGVDLSGEAPVETYLGPDSFIPEADTGAVTELAISEDFEGLMSWVVGLEQSGSYAHELDVEEGELIVDFRT